LSSLREFNDLRAKIRRVPTKLGISIKASSSIEGGYVKGVITYMVMDDLEVKPMSIISAITLLTKFNVRDVGAVEEKVVDLGMDEVWQSP